MVSQIAITAITGYQRWISPRKGFNCAYRVLHGGNGCAGHTKEAIRQHGLWAARPHIRARFAACKLAAATLMEQRQDDSGPRKRKTKGASACDGCSGVGWCGSGKSSGCDATPDCTPDCSCG